MIRLLFFIYCCLPISSNAQKVSALFVGNSLTYFSDTPGKLKIMLESKGDSAYIDQCVAPGFSLWLCFDLEYGTSMLKCIENKLSSRKWDYIIIQNPNDGFLSPARKMKSAILKFDSMAIKNGAKLIMFMPYEGNFFSKYFCDKNNEEVICSNTMYKNVRQVLDSVNVFVNKIQLSSPLIQSPIGEAHYQYDIKYSKSDLYTPDFGHPSELGAYLQACSYYHLITNTFYESADGDSKKKVVEQIIKSLFTSTKK